MCSISVCPNNGIAACCLGFVGDTPILIDAIKLLCTISDNPWKQNSSSCRQADIEKTHNELSKNHCLQKSPRGGGGGGGGRGRASIPGPWTIMVFVGVKHPVHSYTHDLCLQKWPTYVREKDCLNRKSRVRFGVDKGGVRGRCGGGGGGWNEGRGGDGRGVGEDGSQTGRSRGWTV